jgi:hypothetical protein
MGRGKSGLGEAEARVGTGRKGHAALELADFAMLERDLGATSCTPRVEGGMITGAAGASGRGRGENAPG